MVAFAVLGVRVTSQDARGERAFQTERKGGDGDRLLFAYATTVSLPVTRPIGPSRYEEPVDIVVLSPVTVSSFCEFIQDNHHRLY